MILFIIQKGPNLIEKEVTLETGKAFKKPLDIIDFELKDQNDQLYTKNNLRNNMVNKLHIKRANRIRRKLKRINNERFRLTVFRSSRNISAQIIDSRNNKTLVSASSVSKKEKNIKKTDKSLNVAQILVKKALNEL